MPATQTLADVMAPPHLNDRAGAGQRQVAGGLRELLIRLASAAGAAGSVTAVTSSSSARSVLKTPSRKSSRAAVRVRPRLAIVTRAPSGQQDRGQVRGRVAVRERAADGAPRADLRVGQDGERVGDGGAGGRDAGVALQVAVGGERADAELAAVWR